MNQWVQGEEEGEEGDESEEKGGGGDANLSEEWEKMAMAWVSAFPEARTVTRDEVESWIECNVSSLPTDLLSMPRSDLIDRLLSIHGYLRPSQPSQQHIAGTTNTDDVGDGDEEAIPGEEHFHHARFQRTDRWLPVYSWLESLNTNEAVKSKDISDWLGKNPVVGTQLCSRHSKYHLFHYIKKCHMKILKRREKKKIDGMQQPDFCASSPRSKTCADSIELAPFPAGHLSRDIPKDSELYLTKRNEALEKYKLLVALEKKLSPRFASRPG